jgi:hypothetical protein
MPLGLHVRIQITPESVFLSRWCHDMANAFCRGKIRAEREFILKHQTAS